MKTTDLKDDDFTIDLLARAVRKCAKGVSWKNSVLKWMLVPEQLKLVTRLKRELDCGSYRISDYREFSVLEPKKRMIKSPKFRDRVVQCAMVLNGVYDDLMGGMIRESCACQRGKGVVFAQEVLRGILSDVASKESSPADCWFCKVDIKSFFDTIPHDALREMVTRKVSNPRYASMVCEVIDSFGGDRGLGLGSEICQLLANAFVCPMDLHFKAMPSVLGYVRYSDDILMVCRTHSEAKILLKESGRFLAEELGLRMNPKSTIGTLRSGIPFLKWIYRMSDDGKVTGIVSGKTFRRLKRHVRRLERECDEGIVPIDFLQMSIESSLSRLRQGDNQRQIETIEREFSEYEKSYGRRTSADGEISQKPDGELRPA